MNSDQIEVLILKYGAKIVGWFLANEMEPIDRLAHIKMLESMTDKEYFNYGTLGETELADAVDDNKENQDALAAILRAVILALV